MVCNDGRMRGRTGRTVLGFQVLVTAIVFAATTAYAIGANVSAGSIASQVLVSGSFAITGLIAWSRRPDNRMGRLMVAFAWTFMAIILTKPLIPVLVPVGLAAFVV